MREDRAIGKRKARRKHQRKRLMASALPPTTFNPLDVIGNQEDMRRFADFLILPPSQESEAENPHWRQSAEAQLHAVAAYFEMERLTLALEKGAST